MPKLAMSLVFVATSAAAFFCVHLGELEASGGDRKPHQRRVWDLRRHDDERRDNESDTARESWQREADRLREELGIEGAEIGYIPLEINPVPVGLSFEDLSITDETVSFSVHVDTTSTGEVFESLSFGVASLNTGALEVVDVSIGSGLAIYAAENGEPPACDIVIYPNRQAAVGSITKLFAGVPFDSAYYGSEFLRVTYGIRETRFAAPSTSSTLQIFTQEDMEWSRDNTRFIVDANAKASVEVSLTVDPVRHVPGDVDANSALQITDAIGILAHLFFDQPISCAVAADVNRDAAVNVSDPIYLLTALFTTQSSLSEICYPVPPLDPAAREDCASQACE